MQVSLAPAHERPGKARQVSKLIQMAALGLLGAIFGYYLGRLTGGALKQAGVGKMPGELKAILLASIPLTIFAVIALHELGHLIGGWMSGFRFFLFVVGPLRLDREGNRVKASFNRSAALWGGVAGCGPVGNVDPATLRGRMFRMVAGGPVASLIGAAIALALAWFVGNASLLVSSVALFFGFLSTMIAVATLIPMTAGGFVSDGGRLLQLWRGKYEADRWCAIAALSGLSMGRHRPRHWPASLVEASTSHPDHAYDDIAAAWLRYAYHFDRGEREEAGRWLEYALENDCNWPGPARQILYADAAYYYAIEKGEAIRARDYLQRAGSGGFMKPYQIKLSEGAVLLAEGNRQGARNAAEQGLKLLSKVDDGAGVVHRELLDELCRKAA